MRTLRSRVLRRSWVIAAALACAGAGAYWVADRHHDSPADELGENEALEHEGRPGADSPDQAMQWVLLAYRDENGAIPRDGLMRARAQAQAMRLESVQRQ